MLLVGPESGPSMNQLFGSYRQRSSTGLPLVTGVCVGGGCVYV
jgi:hypothetical protein